MLIMQTSFTQQKNLKCRTIAYTSNKVPQVALPIVTLNFKKTSVNIIITSIEHSTRVCDSHESRVATERFGADLTAKLELVALGVGAQTLPRAVQFAAHVTLVVLLASVYVYVLIQHVLILKHSVTVWTRNAVLYSIKQQSSSTILNTVKQQSSKP